MVVWALQGAAIGETQLAMRAPVTGRQRKIGLLPPAKSTDNGFHSVILMQFRDSLGATKLHSIVGFFPCLFFNYKVLDVSALHQNLAVPVCKMYIKGTC